MFAVTENFRSSSDEYTRGLNLKFSVTENSYIVGSGFDFDTAFSAAHLRVLSYLFRNADTP